MGAQDVMRQAIWPLLAVVIVAVGKDLVGGGQRYGERITFARGDDFKTGAIRADSDHAAAEELNLGSVLCDTLRDSLVADADVEVAVHSKTDTRGDVGIDA